MKKFFFDSRLGVFLVTVAAYLLLQLVLLPLCGFSS